MPNDFIKYQSTFSLFVLKASFTTVAVGRHGTEKKMEILHT